MNKPITQPVQALFDLSGQTALVTRATRGVGLQMAYALGEAGARLMLVFGDADELELAVADLQSAGIDARWVLADVTQQAGIDRSVAQTLHRMGEIDVLVNYSPCDWQQATNPNLAAYMKLSQRVVDQSMMARSLGCIINVAHMAPLGGETNMRNTLMPQAAVDAIYQLTQTLAAQWRQNHITVNTLCWTGDGDPQNANAADGLRGTCMLLASRAGKHMTGQCLSVNDA